LKSLLKAILDLGFENPTEVQEKAIPYCGKDTDMVALAQTGTGENGSIWFSSYSEIDANNRIQALILSQHANFVCRLPTKLKLL
jgi:ATP-dependent RNA helicase DeaD